MVRSGPALALLLSCWLSACTGDDHEDASTSSLVADGSVLVADAEGHGFVTAWVATETSFDRLGLRFDAPSGTRVEVRSWPDSAASSTWMRLEESWAEADAHVASASLPRTTGRWQLRFQVDDPHQVGWFAAEAFTYAPEPRSPGVEAPTPTLEAPLPRYLSGLVAGSAYVPRAAWGARPHQCTSTDPTKTGLVIHHTVSPNNDSLDMPRRMRQLQAYFMDSRGYCDMGYHFLVGQDGKTYQGRIETFLGAHAANGNRENLGISLIGDFTSILPPAAQWQGIVKFVRDGATGYAIPIDRAHVKGHRQVGTTATACPGNTLYPKLDQLVAEARQGVTPPPPPPTTGVLKGLVYWGTDPADAALAADPSRRLANTSLTFPPSAENTRTGSDGTFSVTLPAGTYTVAASAPGYVDGTAGGPVTITVGAETSASVMLRPLLPADTTPPVVLLEAPLDGLVTSADSIELRGHASDETALASVEVQGVPAALSGGAFTATVALVSGENSLVVQALDAAGNVGEARVKVTRTETGGIEGRVVDARTGAGIGRALLIVTEQRLKVPADENGDFRSELPLGPAKGIARAAGHVDLAFEVNVVAGFTRVDLAMEPAPPDDPGSAGDPPPAEAPGGCGCGSGSDSILGTLVLLGLLALRSHRRVIAGLVTMLVAASAMAARPTGNLDAATTAAIGGWARDPDHAGPIAVHIYIDGHIAHAMAADAVRPDLPFADKAHGFTWVPPPLGPGAHTVNVYAIGIDASGNPDAENPALPHSPRTITGRCTDLRESAREWCNGVGGYYPNRGADTDYLYSDTVRAGVNRSYGGTILELYAADHTRNRLVEHGGGAIQLSIWGYDPVGPTAFFPTGTCSTQRYATEAACLAAGHASCMAWAYSQGAHVANCSAVKACIAGWGAGAPFNPIQAQGSACDWDTPSNNVSSSSVGTDTISIRRVAPNHYTKSGAMQGLEWEASTTLVPAGLKLDYRITYAGPYTLTPHPQEIPAVFPGPGINASFEFYAGAAPYTDAAGGVSSAAPGPSGVLMQMAGRGPYPHPAGDATITEHWATACNAARDECVTVAAFSPAYKELHGQPSGPGRAEGYLTPLGGFAIAPGLDESVTAYVFPYRWNAVVAGKTVREWIFEYAAAEGVTSGGGTVDPNPDPDPDPDPGTGTGTDPDPGTGTGTDPGTGTDTGTGTGTGTGTDPGTGTGTGTDTGTDPGTGTGTGTPTGGGSGTGTATLDVTPPFLSFQFMSGREVFGTSFAVTGTAADASGIARVEVNGSNADLDSSGGFVADVDLAEGLNTITATAYDKVGNHASIRAELVRVVLTSGITGRVTDASTGAPIRGAQVRFSDMTTTTYTDSGGHFEQALEAGTWRGSASKGGYKSGLFSVTLADGIESVVVKLEPLPADADAGSDDATPPAPAGCGCAAFDVPASLALIALVARRRTSRR